MLQHFPRWKAKEKLVVDLRKTCKPPCIKASDERGLYADLEFASAMTIDQAQGTETGAGDEKTR